MTQDDIFYNNNHNLFLASEETLKASKEAGRFILDCRWVEPIIESSHASLQWNGRLTAFEELTIDRERQRIFLFDYDEKAALLRGDTSDTALRLDFERFWLNRKTHDPYDSEIWDSLRDRFRRKGLELPYEPNQNHGPHFLLNAIYSAREGRPIGWRFHKFIEVAHCIEGNHKDALRVFRHALSTYGRASLIIAEDHQGKWKRKVEAYKPLLEADHPDYDADRRFDALIDFLFPELLQRRPTQ